MTLLAVEPCRGADETDVAPLAAVVGANLKVPLVQGGNARYVNLDYAASAPALRAVADRVAELLPLYSSVHRGAGYASAVCTSAYEGARAEIAAFVGAGDDDALLFTRNTTDALNLLATAVPRSAPGGGAGRSGGVVHLDIEHHANLLPWQRLGARVVRAASTRAETVAAVEAELAASPAALLAVTGASNVTGECPPLAELTSVAHRHGARIVVDGAQLVPHRRVSLTESGIDYLVFSGHKIYAPFGAGVLAGRRDWLESAPPYLAGGGAVREVRLGGTDWAPVPARHEAGTPNVVGAVALAAACRAVAALGPDAVAAHETALVRRLTQGLAAIDGIRPLRLWPSGPADGESGETDRIGVVTFTVDGYPAGLVAQYLSAEHGIGVRDGRFCAHPLLARLTAEGTGVRASLGLGSRAADVDRLVAALAELRDRGPAWTYAVTEAGYAPDPDPRALPDWLAGEVHGPASPCTD
ncbi:MAG: aminotransferase class V-fold PLP-dependent enzyme [Trebonia sp.]|jgi:selenocysteine lyase/cysteine desulfurase